MFIDKARIIVSSGKGGDGHVSFRREKYVPAGGPDGGDGGKGGDVVFVVDEGLNTLTDFRHVRKYAAQHGEDGKKKRMAGKKGQDLEIKVPEGTVIREANYCEACAGIITWCHTFSPSKMWINGLASLQKPYCHLATQYNKEIPNEEIDMDFMNLNQAAHGDREHGFIAARLRLPRKVIAGYWKDEKVHKRLGDWMKAAVGVAVSKEMKVMRFGDNMREVAVTEGDKVEVQTKLGWQVNTWAVGDLVGTMNAVTEAEIDAISQATTSTPATWKPSAIRRARRSR